MTYNEASTRSWLIDPVLRGKGFDVHWKLKLETPAPVEPTGHKGSVRIMETDHGHNAAKNAKIHIDLIRHTHTARRATHNPRGAWRYSRRKRLPSPNRIP